MRSRTQKVLATAGVFSVLVLARAFLPRAFAAPPQAERNARSGANTNTVAQSLQTSTQDGPVKGSGTPSFIPIWITSSRIGNSTISESSGHVTLTGGLTTTGDTQVGGNVLIDNGDLDLPQTTGTTVGVINMGGSPFIHGLAVPGFEANSTFVGVNAGNFSLSGPGNTAIGNLALNSDTTGSDDTAVGVTALTSNTTGAGNTAVGLQALTHNTTGTRNTAVGVAAGANGNVTGSHNTFIGAVADGGSNDLTNATAIGYNAIVGASNSLVLGGTGENAVNVGIGTLVPTTRLHVAGGDVGTSNAGVGLIVKSPDGTKCARIGIDNFGAIAVTSLACPF
jgi:hypothetical protein